jgi:hypothetical protein
MKHLVQYIIEKLEKSEDVKELSDKMLQDLSKKGNLKVFVDELNKILGKTQSGDNTKLWMAALKDLFDGQNEEGKKYTASPGQSISCADLYPTQSEIDIENSAKWATKDWGVRCIPQMFDGSAFGANFAVPVLVYKDKGKNWIIDGHHRWSQVGLMNPDAHVSCMVVEGPEPVQDFLKIVQGMIAAIIGDDSKPNKGDGGKLPVGKAAPQNNIFGSALKGDKLAKRVVELFKGHDNILADAIKYLNDAGVDVKSAEDIGKLVEKNRDIFVSRKQTPPSWAAPRPVMPQTDRAGITGPDDAAPANTGSALNILLNGAKFKDLK